MTAVTFDFAETPMAVSHSSIDQCGKKCQDSQQRGQVKNLLELIIQDLTSKTRRLLPAACEALLTRV